MCQFVLLCFCQMLFELVYSWQSYCNNKKVYLLLRHRVVWTQWCLTLLENLEIYWSFFPPGNMGNILEICTVSPKLSDNFWLSVVNVTILVFKRCFNMCLLSHLILCWHTAFRCESSGLLWIFLLLWPWPWPDDLHIRTWPVLPWDTSDVQIWTSCVKDFISYRLTRKTDIQTDRIHWNYKPSWIISNNIINIRKKILNY